MGEKVKGETLSTNLEFQRMMPGSEHTVRTPLPCCSLMCIVPEQADFTEVLEGCGHFPDSNFDPRSYLLSLSKEPVKCAEQLGKPERSVLLLRELVSWCGAWAWGKTAALISKILTFPPGPV